MPTFEVDVEGATYDVDAPDEATAWTWANQVHKTEGLKPLQKNKGPTLGQRVSALTPETELHVEGAKGLARGAISTGQAMGRGVQAALPGPLGVAVGAMTPQMPEWLKSIIAPGYSGSVMDRPGAQFAGTSGEMLGAGLPFGAYQPGAALLSAGGEAAFGEPGKLIGAVAPGILTAGKPVAEATVRGAMRGTNPLAMQRDIAMLKQAGIDAPTVGVATGRFAPQALETTIGRIPGGAGTMMKKGEEMAAGMGARVEDIASTLSPAREKFQAGRALMTGIDDFVEQLRTRWQKLNAPVDQALSGTNIQASKFGTALKDVGAPIQGAEDLSVILKARDKTLGSAWEALQAQNGVLPYSAARQLRSAIGEKLANPQLIDDISRRHYKALYAALTEDIRGAAKQANVLKAFDNSNAVFKEGVNTIEDILGGIGGKATWEEAYKAAISGTKEGPSKILALKRTLPRQNFDDFRATFIRGLGKERPSAGSDIDVGFSPETFLTKYRDLDDPVRSALFGDKTALRSSLDTVAEAAGRLRESKKAFPNLSGTSGATGALAMGASIPTAFAFMMTGNVAVGASIIGGAMATSLGAMGGAKLMTNPRFMKWLADSTTIPATKLAGHAARLNAIATMEHDDEDKTAMKAVAQQLSGPRRFLTQE